MATYTLDQYQRVWRRRSSELRKIAHRSSRDAAAYMQATARGLAPKKSGALRAGIQYRQVKDAQYEVSSGVSKDFPYQFWINQNAPFRAISAVWNRREKTVYGDGSHIITGTPRFWHFAFLRTQNFFGRVARGNVQKMLRARLT